MSIIVIIKTTVTVKHTLRVKFPEKKVYRTEEKVGRPAKWGVEVKEEGIQILL